MFRFAGIFLLRWCCQKDIRVLSRCSSWTTEAMYSLDHLLWPTNKPKCFLISLSRATSNLSAAVKYSAGCRISMFGHTDRSCTRLYVIIFIIFLGLVFEALAMSKTNSIPNYFLKLIPERKGRLMDSRTHTDSDGTTINPSCHVEFCCSSMSLYGAKSSDLFLNKTIQLNCARSRCAASATDDITGEFESFFGSVVKLSVFINYK